MGGQYSLAVSLALMPGLLVTSIVICDIDKQTDEETDNGRTIERQTEERTDLQRKDNGTC